MLSHKRNKYTNDRNRSKMSVCLQHGDVVCFFVEIVVQFINENGTARHRLCAMV